MVISPLNHMFWRSVAEAILIDLHMLFYGELKISCIRRCSRNEGVCIRQRFGLLVRTPSKKGKNRITAQLT